jgi:DNA-binding PadR family transcriptional regulator
MIRLPLTMEHALLGLLRERPRHGYDMYQSLSDPDGLGAIWHVKQSQLYALLAKLEADGFIAASLKPQDHRPTRRVFRLTKLGRQAFLAWVQSPVPHGREMRLDFLAKFYFARREGRTVAGQLIAAQRAVCRQWLEAQRARAERLRDTHLDEWLVHQFRIGQLEAILRWLDACEQALSQSPGVSS